MNNRYILHLDTSTKVCSVALSKNGQLIEEIHSDDQQYRHGEILTSYIDQVMQNAELRYKEISAVSIASGPGSYTGLRIGTSTAKGICFALQVPLIAVDSLTALYEHFGSTNSEINVCSMIDARRMEVYSAIFAPNGTVLKEISADVLDEQSYAEFEPMICIGDATKKMVDTWKDRKILFDHQLQASAAGQVRLAYQKFIEADFEDTAYFEPFYLKDFMAIKPKSQKIS